MTYRERTHNTSHRIPTLLCVFCTWGQERVCRWRISTVNSCLGKMKQLHMVFQPVLLIWKDLILQSCWGSICLTTLGLWRFNHCRMGLPSRIGWGGFALYCVHFYWHKLTALLSCQFPEVHQFCYLRTKFRKYQTNIYLCSISQWAKNHNSEFNYL